MPSKIFYICDKCRLDLDDSVGCRVYVTDDSGKRIYCYHPDEEDGIRRVLGEDASEELIRQRKGHVKPYVCYDCVKQFKRDEERDEKICPNCNSTKVICIFYLTDKPCPRCENGRIRKKSSEIFM